MDDGTSKTYETNMDRRGTHHIGFVTFNFYERRGALARAGTLHLFLDEIIRKCGASND